MTSHEKFSAKYISKSACTSKGYVVIFHSLNFNKDTNLLNSKGLKQKETVCQSLFHNIVTVLFFLPIHIKVDLGNLNVILFVQA